MYCQRMHATSEFRRKGLVYHAVTLDPALAFERVRHDIHAEV